MIDLVIVGGGYWGVASALAAERNGLSVLMIDGEDEMNGSKAAGGHFSLKWFKGQFRGGMERAYEDAMSLGVEFDTKGALINTLYDRKKFGNKYLKPKDDWWVFMPEQFLGLRQPDKKAIVSKIKKTDTVEIQTNCGDIKARNVLVCAGVWTDFLLHSSNLPRVGVSALAGSAMSFRGENIEKLMLHQTTPYRQISIRNWGKGYIRIGETSEYKENEHQKYLDKMIGTVDHHLYGYKPHKLFRGYRAMRKKPFIGKVEDNIYVATGGGRNGGVMSFYAARKIVSSICGYCSL